MHWDAAQNGYVFYIERGNDADNVSVLGTDFMSGHDVYFDIENQRIGFAETTCEYENLVRPHSYNSRTSQSSVQTKKEESGMSPGGKFAIVVLVFGVLGAGFFYYRKIRQRRAQEAVDNLKLDDLEFNNQDPTIASDDNLQSHRESPQNSIERAIAEVEAEKAQQNDGESPSSNSLGSGKKFTVEDRDLQEEAQDHGWRRKSKSIGSRGSSESDGTGEIL